MIKITLTGQCTAGLSEDHMEEISKCMKRCMKELEAVAPVSIEGSSIEGGLIIDKDKIPDAAYGKAIELEYNPRKNIVLIDAKESDFNKDFLKYMLEFKDIPNDAKRIFLK